MMHHQQGFVPQYQYNNRSMTNEFDLKLDNSLLESINDVREKINKKVEDIANIEANTYVDLIFYILIVGIMCFFLYIIIDDLYKTLKFYYKQNDDSQQTSYRKSKATHIDDNEYQFDFESSVNSNKFIKDNLEKGNRVLNSDLHELKQFKKKNKIDHNTYASIDTKTINHLNDNYVYNDNKNVTSFWNTMFKKPKYPSVTNNSSGGFFEFV
jgi:hypothetical protein